MSKGNSTIRNQVLTSVSVEILLLRLRSGFFFFSISSAFVSPKRKFHTFPLRLGTRRGWFVSGTVSHLRWSSSLIDGTQMGLNFCPCHPSVACLSILHSFLWLGCSCYSKDSEPCREKQKSAFVPGWMQAPAQCAYKRYLLSSCCPQKTSP